MVALYQAPPTFNLPTLLSVYKNFDPGRFTSPLDPLQLFRTEAPLYQNFL